MSGRLEDLGLRVPVPGWQLLDAVRVYQFTGEITVVGAPVSRLYADRGRIYFAEAHDAPPLAAVLVARGLVTPHELALGSVRVNGHDHLGRLFERARSIPADTVRVAVAELTEQVVRDVAGQTLAAVTLEPYAFHRSGIHVWDQPAQVAPPERPWAAPSRDAMPVAEPADGSAVVWDRPAGPEAVYEGLEGEPLPSPQPAPTEPVPAPVADEAVGWAVSPPEVPELAEETFAVIWPNGDAEAPDEHAHRSADGAVVNGNGHSGEVLDMIAEAWLAAEAEPAERRA